MPTLWLDLVTPAVVVLVPLVIGRFAVLHSAFRGPVETGETY